MSNTSTRPTIEQMREQLTVFEIEEVFYTKDYQAMLEDIAATQAPLDSTDGWRSEDDIVEYFKYAPEEEIEETWEDTLGCNTSTAPFSTAFSYIVATHSGTHPGTISVSQSWGSQKRTYFEDLTALRAWCLEAPGDHLTILPGELAALFNPGERGRPSSSMWEYPETEVEGLMRQDEGQTLTTSAGSLAHLIKEVTS